MITSTIVIRLERESDADNGYGGSGDRGRSRATQREILNLEETVKRITQDETPRGIG